MPSDEILIDTEQRMEKAIEVLKKNLGGIRTGRANPGLVDSVRVDVYGSPTPLKQIASVGAPEPTQIVIRPYDAGVIKEIEKAIVSADLGFNPQENGWSHQGIDRRGQDFNSKCATRRKQGCRW